MTNTDRPILIVDAMNLFIRSWAAFPSMNTNGEQTGGIVGFLKTLRRIVADVQPNVVYVAWEGGGSQKRRALYSDYKMNRKPEKLNRFYEDDIPDTDENKNKQIITLLSILKHMPVCQLYVSDCEGDDVIAYLCRVKFRDRNKIIMSSDKDMLQLLDDRTKTYNLHKKTYVTEPDVMSEFRVLASNFALAKSLCGDQSDNIPGIKGLGFKTLAKHLPFLGTTPSLLVQDVIDYCSAHIDEQKMYRRIVEQQEHVKLNWRLVYLDGGMLAPNQAQRIDRVVDTFVPSTRRMDVMRIMHKEGINNLDVNDLFYAFNCVDGLTNS